MTALPSFKAFLSRYKLHIVSFVFVLFFATTAVFAAPSYPGSQWQPGETLDPGAEDINCTPGSSNCSVDISSSGGSDLWSENGSDIYFSGGKVGVGLDSPLANLHILATQTLIPGEDAVPGTVGSTSYTGSGLDDATFGGQYDGVTEDCQILAGIADLAPGNGFDNDRFQYGFGGGPGCNGGGGPVEITPGVAQELVDGITITFASGTGHTVLEMSPLNENWSADVTPGTAGTPDTYEPGDDPFLITDESSNQLFNVANTGKVTIQSTDDTGVLSLYNYLDDLVFSISSEGALNLEGNETRINGITYFWPDTQAVSDGYVLTNDGSGTLTWEEVAAGESLPSQTGNSGKYLTTDGTDASWATVLPDQAGNNGNYLMSNGVAAQWTDISSLIGQTNEDDREVWLGENAGAGNASTLATTFIGTYAGYQAIDATYSTFIGDSAGADATYAYESNFIGYNAGRDALSAWNSNFIGKAAGYGADSAAYSNFMGTEAGRDALNGSYSNLFGYQAGYQTNSEYANFFGYLAGAQTTGGISTKSNFIGYEAGRSASGASANFIGDQAGKDATTATSSNFMGTSAGLSASGSQYSNFIGIQAGSYSSSTTRTNAIGYYTGSGTTADDANFIGAHAGYLSGADRSVFIGGGMVDAVIRGAGQSATSASNSVFIGAAAGYWAQNAANSIFIGYKAGYNDTANNTVSGTSILIGDNSSTGGFENSIAIGAGATNTISGEFLVDDSYDYFNFNGIRYLMPSDDDADQDVLVTDGSNSLSWDPKNVFAGDIFLGDDYPFGANGSNIIRLDNSYGNVIMGNLMPLLPINDSDFVGNTLIGDAVGYSIDFGGAGASRNTWIGQYAGRETLDGSYNTFYGSQSGGGWVHSNAFNVAIGVDAFYGSGGGTAGSSNTVIGGYQTGYDAVGNSNVYLGSGAGFEVTGSESTFVGSEAGSGASTANNSIFIGYRAGYNDSVNNSVSGTSILIGRNTSTGDCGGGVGCSNSIALGTSATNTAANQFMIGSVGSPITEMVLVGDYTGGGCTFDVNGMSCSSDERLKKNIEDLDTNVLDTLLNVRTVTFNWDNDLDTENHIGFIAQDIQEYFPELVSTGSTGYLSVNYAGITPVLVEAIREIDAKVVGIQSLTDQTFVESIRAWLASAVNGIENIFTKKITTEQICITDSDGEVCVDLDREKINKLKEVLNDNSGGTNSGSGASNNEQDPGNIIEDPLEIVDEVPIVDEEVVIEESIIETAIEEELPIIEEEIILEDEPEEVAEEISEPVVEESQSEPTI